MGAQLSGTGEPGSDARLLSFSPHGQAAGVRACQRLTTRHALCELYSQQDLRISRRSRPANTVEFPVASQPLRS